MISMAPLSSLPQRPADILRDRPCWWTEASPQVRCVLRWRRLLRLDFRQQFIASIRLRCSVFLGEASSGVYDLEAPVLRAHQFKKMTSIGTLWICNVLFRRVVLSATFLGKMKLPQGLEPGSLSNRLESWD